MSVLISVNQLGHAFGSQTLFENLTFSLSKGEKTALIGKNGAGKSTLLKIIAGVLKPDFGEIARTRGLRVGYLEQVPQFKPGIKVRDAVLGDLIDQESWESIGIAEEAMSRLGITSKENSLEEKKVSELSGGWQKKVALARELAKQPDILLLDEPTNHLDLDSILWLEDWIKQSSLCILTISHDRSFLRQIANRVIEVDRRNPDGILSIQGNYDTFLTTKEAYLQQQASRASSMQNLLRNELTWLRRGAKARTTKQKARIDRTLELQSSVQNYKSLNRSREMDLEFESSTGQPKKLVDAQNISKSYGGRTLFENLDLKITPKTRIGLLGKNGIGKSTLIKVLVGNEKPTTGEVFKNDRLQVAYFEQNRAKLDPNKTVLKTVCPYGETVEFNKRMIHVRSYLEKFLFTSEQGDMPVRMLSGGEQSRLLLALLMLEPANLLVLDEPTNDLDLTTLEVLEDALENFDGAVILVSHDRAFLDGVCNQILVFPEMLMFSDLDQWETWRKAKISSGSKTKNIKNEGTPTGAAKSAKKLSYNELREFESMEVKILEKEQLIEKMMAEGQTSEELKNPVKLRTHMEKIAKIQQEVENLYVRWAELEKLKN